jgi:prephenate dehydrogenase
MQPRVLALIGVGLIGGSVGLAVRSRGGTRVLGVDRDAKAAALARQRGIVDEMCADAAAACSTADLVVVSTPVDGIAEQVVVAASACRPGAVLTDTGSAKSAVVRAIEGRLPAGVSFVGGHPLAGSEKQGAAHAEASLFHNRLVVLTPTSDESAVARVRAFWESLGARVHCMTPEAHDRAVALTSHLPHLVASSLAGILPAEFAEFTATGFRDMTRIADGNAALWGAILAANRAEVLDALARFEGRLDEFRTALASGEPRALQDLLRAGRRTTSPRCDDGAKDGSA